MTSSSHSHFTGVHIHIILTILLCIRASIFSKPIFLRFVNIPSFLSYLFTFFILLLGFLCLVFAISRSRDAAFEKAAMYGTGPGTTQMEFTKGLALLCFFSLISFLSGLFLFRLGTGETRMGLEKWFLICQLGVFLIGYPLDNISASRLLYRSNS